MHSSQDSFPLPAHRHGWEEGKESVILEENKNNAYLKQWELNILQQCNVMIRDDCCREIANKVNTLKSQPYSVQRYTDLQCTE